MGTPFRLVLKGNQRAATILGGPLKKDTPSGCTCNACIFFEPNGHLPAQVRLTPARLQGCPCNIRPIFSYVFRISCFWAGGGWGWSVFPVQFKSPFPHGEPEGQFPCHMSSVIPVQLAPVAGGSEWEFQHLRGSQPRARCRGSKKATLGSFLIVDFCFEVPTDILYIFLCLGSLLVKYVSYMFSD